MKRGFSLVELSIVLVILGLLTGGILAGQSIIRASQLRAVTAEYQRYTTATQSFRDKYFALPGDMNNATAFWGYTGGTGCTNSSGTAVTTPGTCDGDGNGSVSGANVANQSGEDYQFWRQLALAGLIEGSYNGMNGGGGVDNSIPGTNEPISKMTNGGWGAYGWGQETGNVYMYALDYGNAFMIGAPLSGAFTRGALIKPEEAWNIDTKMDDGRPGYGKVIAYYWNACAIGGASSSDLANSTYNLSVSTTQCALFFIKQF